MADEDVPCYVCFAPICRCLIGASVDDGSNPKDVARDVAKWIKNGNWVERKTVGYVRTSKFGHTCGKKR